MNFKRLEIQPTIKKKITVILKLSHSVALMFAAQLKQRIRRKEQLCYFFPFFFAFL